MNSGVYNRSLFRKKGTEARDQLRRMGGIMASSPELMQAGMMDQPPVGQPPMAPQTGQGEVRFMAPNLLQPLQPQPMMQPQQPMQRPMAPQQPLQPQPMMPPQPMAPQQPMQRFQDGGDVAPFRMMSASFSQPNPNVGKMSAGAGALTFDRAIEVGANAPVAIGQSALPEDLKATLAEIDTALKDPTIPDAQKAKAVTDAMGVESTGDPQTDMQKVVSQLGLNPDREAKIDSLNKAMLGFAIASGTSGSAMENIANGMLAGLKQIKDTEVRRAGAEQELAVAQLQAAGGGAGGAGSRDYRNPADTYQNAYLQTMNSASFGDIPEEMEREAYARQVAEDVVRKSYTPAQLQGTAFEYLSPPSSTTQTPGLGTQPDPIRDAQNVVNQIRDSEQLSPEEKQQRIATVRQRLTDAGLNPDLVQ